MLRLVVPDLYVSSVLDLAADRLRGLGLSALLLDVDCTLARYRSLELAPGVTEWLAQLRAAGIAACLVSNGHAGRIRRLAGQLGLPFVAGAVKPTPFGCLAALKKLGTPRNRTAMVGDQVFADVVAGRLARLFCILVRPIHPEDEPWYTRLKRPLETFVRRRLERGNAGQVEA